MVSCAARPSRARSSADSARRVTLSTIPGASAGFTTNPLRSEEHTSELQSPCNLVCRIIRSEEHTSELQSPCNIVCRLLLEKKIISRFSEHGDLGDQTVLGLQRRLGSTVFFVSGRVITHLYDMLAL